MENWERVRKKWYRHRWNKYEETRHIPRHEKEYVIDTLNLIQQDALRYRLSNLIIWYIDKAESSKRWYQLLTIVTLGMNAFIPIVNLFLKVDHANIWSSIFAALAGMALGINNLCHFKDNWTRYRKSAEEIKKALSQYAILIENCESKCDRCECKENGRCKLLMRLLTTIDHVTASECAMWYELQKESGDKEKEK